MKNYSFFELWLAWGMRCKKASPNKPPEANASKIQTFYLDIGYKKPDNITFNNGFVSSVFFSTGTKNRMKYGAADISIVANRA